MLSEVFAVVLKDFNATQSQEALARLLLLQKWVLGPCHGGRSHTIAFLHTILSRLDRLKAGDIAGLWSEAATLHPSLQHSTFLCRLLPAPQPPASHHNASDR